MPAQRRLSIEKSCKMRHNPCMNQTQQAKATKKFIENRIGYGYEKGETQKFWLDLLTTVFGVENIAQFICFEIMEVKKCQNHFIRGCCSLKTTILL